MGTRKGVEEDGASHGREAYMSGGELWERPATCTGVVETVVKR